MNPIGKPFIELASVESSNNYATQLVQAQLAVHGTAVFAYEQTKGKGQRGKTWITAPGENIILTIIVEPVAFLTPKQQFILSAAVALACRDFFTVYLEDDVKIKWPNDLYWKDRKAGGILIENVLQGHEWKYAIIGIGININQTTFAANLPNPVSLKQICSRTFKPIDLAKELCDCLQNRWKQVEDGDIDILLKDYNNKLYKLNESVKFTKGNESIQASVKGVNTNGALVIVEEPGVERIIGFGEWEWMVGAV